jgi:hypothetical protein
MVSAKPCVLKRCQTGRREGRGRGIGVRGASRGVDEFDLEWCASRKGGYCSCTYSVPVGTGVYHTRYRHHGPVMHAPHSPHSDLTWSRECTPNGCFAPSAPSTSRASCPIVKTFCLHTDPQAYWRHVGAERLVYGIPSWEMPKRIRAEQARRGNASMSRLQIRMLILEQAGPCGRSGWLAVGAMKYLGIVTDGVQGLGTRHAGPAGWFLHVGGHIAIGSSLV